MTPDVGGKNSYSTVAPVRPSHLFDRRTCSIVADSKKNFRAFGPKFFFLVKFLGPVPQRRAPLEPWIRLWIRKKYEGIKKKYTTNCFQCSG